MQKFRADPAGLGIGYPILGLNSIEFSKADPVYIDTNGLLTISSTTNKVLGYYTGQGETLASDNQTVAKVKPNYIYGLGVEMIFGSDQDCTQTDIGAYADMGTATTGAFELNLAAGVTGQFLVLGFDPEDESDDDAVVVMCAEPQQLAFAQA